MEFAVWLQKIVDRQDLSSDEAVALMNLLMEGQATASQVGGMLMALRMKGVTPVELAGFATAMRRHAHRIQVPAEKLVDTCGTGGGAPTFNISTAAALIAAAAGVRVAKHGNRAVTGKCGSAEVLEALGVQFPESTESLEALLMRTGFVFLFAPNHHPAMRHVGPVRRELGVRTVFNQLGPLANPAGASRQLIGVYDRAMLRPMAEALRELGAERALVAHGADGIDEISPCGPTFVAELRDGKIVEKTLTPGDFGLTQIDSEELQPGVDAAANADILREALYEVDSPRSRAVIPSAAAAIWLAGEATNLPEAAAKAKAAVRNGLAMAKLEAIVHVSAQVAAET